MRGPLNALAEGSLCLCVIILRLFSNDLNRKESTAFLKLVIYPYLPRLVNALKASEILLRNIMTTHLNMTA